MNELQVIAKQNFMGKDIPVALGGFGEGKKCVSDKTIAEIHGQPEREIRRRITDNINRFTENADFIDLKKRVGENHTLELLICLGYAKQSITQAEHIYILSERGYAKLIKIMDTDLAWEIHDKLIDEYFAIREQKTIDSAQLSPELQMFQKIFNSVAEQQLEQRRQAAQIEAVQSRVEAIREVVAIDTTSWRDDTGNILRKIGTELGGGQAYSQIRTESYELLSKRMGVNLKQRLTNKRRRMADEGVCKSARDRLSYVDIIAEDKKLIEGYTAIVKEMAIRYGIGKENE